MHLQSPSPHSICRPAPLNNQNLPANTRDYCSVVLWWRPADVAPDITQKSPKRPAEFGVAVAASVPTKCVGLP